MLLWNKNRGSLDRDTTHNGLRNNQRLSDHMAVPSCDIPSHSAPRGPHQTSTQSGVRDSSPVNQTKSKDLKTLTPGVFQVTAYKAPYRKGTSEYTSPIRSCRASNWAFSSLFSYSWYMRFTGHLRKASNVHKQTQINRRQQHGRYSGFLDSSKTLKKKIFFRDDIPLKRKINAIKNVFLKLKKTWKLKYIMAGRKKISKTER